MSRRPVETAKSPAVIGVHAGTESATVRQDVRTEPAQTESRITELSAMETKRPAGWLADSVMRPSWLRKIGSQYDQSVTYAVADAVTLEDAISLLARRTARVESERALGAGER